MMKGWVDLVGWTPADGLLTQVVTHQMKIEHATGKVRQPRPTFFPLLRHLGDSSFVTAYIAGGLSDPQICPNRLTQPLAGRVGSRVILLGGLTPQLHRKFKHWHRYKLLAITARLTVCQSLAGELSMPCARPVADWWPLMWVNCPL